MNIKEILVKRKTRILWTLFTFVSGVVVGYLFSGFPTLSSAATWVGGSLTFTWVFSMFWGVLKEARQDEKEGRIRKQNANRKLNDKVFKKWENVSAPSYMFHIKIKTEEDIDSYLFEKAKRFLKDESDETREILRLWTQIGEIPEDSLLTKHNRIGKELREKITAKLREAYPSLQAEEAKYVKVHDNCFVTNNIIGFVESALKPKCLENEAVNWEKVLEKEFYNDVEPPIWKLICHEVCIQSENENDVDKTSFQQVMTNLIQHIRSDLRQQSELEEEINTALQDFRERMHRLTVDIDLL